MAKNQEVQASAEEPRKLKAGERLFISSESTSFVSKGCIFGPGDVVEAGKDIPLDVCASAMEKGLLSWVLQN